MFNSNVLKIGDISGWRRNPLVFILGPCQIENRDHALFMAEKITKSLCSIFLKIYFQIKF